MARNIHECPPLLSFDPAIAKTKTAFFNKWTKMLTIQRDSTLCLFRWLNLIVSSEGSILSACIIAIASYF
jgi:hypothetical protein